VTNFFEPYVGQVLAETKIPREDLFVQTKFVSQPHHKPFPPPYPQYDSIADEACHHSFMKSLENLKTTYIDAFLINAPELTAKPMLSLLDLVQTLKERGMVRYTGICNIATVDILKDLHETLPSAIQIVQNPFHSPWDPDYKIPLYCRQHGIQYNTFYTLTTSDRIIKDKVIGLISTRTNISPQAVFLQYCIQSDIVPLVGARSQKNLLPALALANGDVEPLRPNDMRAIGRLLAEQSIINRYRAVKLLDRRRKQIRKEQGQKKMLEDQEREREQTVSEREAQEQIIVERAKARAKALAQSLRYEADEGLKERTNSVDIEGHQGPLDEAEAKEIPLQTTSNQKDTM
jgi:diketogulonate reductase-like aldo/keto reductase